MNQDNRQDFREPSIDDFLRIAINTRIKHLEEQKEYQRQTLNAVHSIRGWIVFFGILVILALIFGACTVMLV